LREPAPATYAMLQPVTPSASSAVAPPAGGVGWAAAMA
jgi:hypothetical protein